LRAGGPWWDTIPFYLLPIPLAGAELGVELDYPLHHWRLIDGTAISLGDDASEDKPSDGLLT
jgi:hypothetical protein